MILMLDLETTGLDPVTNRIWEIGALLVDEQWTSIGKFTARLWDDEIAKQLEENQAVLPNLPPLELIKETGLNPTLVWGMFSQFLPDVVSYGVAYNKEFDFTFFREETVKQGWSLDPRINQLLQANWVCAMNDVEAHGKHKCRKLGHLCLDHGLAVDPSVLHGALADIELTQRLMQKIGVSPTDMFLYQTEPWHVLRAFTVEPWKDNGASTALAKELGYSWEVPRQARDKKFTKCWVKVVKQRFLEEEFKTAEGKFLVREIKE